MERLIHDGPYSNNAIATEQQGFVLKKSVVTNLLETVDQISDDIDKEFHVLVVFLDFAKVVPQSQISFMWFLPGFVDWVSDFLFRRRHSES